MPVNCNLPAATVAAIPKHTLGRRAPVRAAPWKRSLGCRKTSCPLARLSLGMAHPSQASRRCSLPQALPSLQGQRTPVCQTSRSTPKSLLSIAQIRGCTCGKPGVEMRNQHPLYRNYLICCGYFVIVAHLCTIRRGRRRRAAILRLILKRFFDGSKSFDAAGGSGLCSAASRSASVSRGMRSGATARRT